jgi:hypothetical protein
MALFACEIPTPPDMEILYLLLGYRVMSRLPEIGTGCREVDHLGDA